VTLSQSVRLTESHSLSDSLTDLSLTDTVCVCGFVCACVVVLKLIEVLNMSLRRKIDTELKKSAAKLTHSKLGDEEAKYLAEKLKNNPVVKTLNLSYNNIGDEGVRYVSDAIKHNTSMEWIYLSNNNIGAEGARYVSDAIKHNTSITMIYLGFNNIGDEGARYVSDAIKHNTSITHIWLNNNNIGAEGARYLSDAIKHNTSIAEIDLHSNNIGAEGARYLSDAIKHNTSITKIDLHSNNIGAEGARYVSDAIKHNTSITKISLRNNNISQSVLSSINDLLKHDRMSDPKRQHESFMPSVTQSQNNQASTSSSDSKSVSSLSTSTTASVADSTTLAESSEQDLKMIEVAEYINAHAISELGSQVSVDSLTTQFADLIASVNQVQHDLQQHEAIVSDRAPSGSVAILLEQHQHELASMLNAHKQKLLDVQQMAYIRANEQLSAFYLSMQLYMESAFVSARSLHSGYTKADDDIGNSRGMSTGSKIASVLSRGLKKAGKLIPVIGAFVEALGSVAVSVSTNAAKIGIRRIAASAASVPVMSECVERVARLMCLHLHDILMHLSASSSSRTQRVRATLQSARGDVYTGKCAELAKSSVTRMLRDLMLASSDSKKVLSVPFDASDACVLSVCSFLLETELHDLSIDASVQERIKAHTAASMPAESVATMSASATVTAPAAGPPASIGLHNSVSDSKSANFADAAEVEQLKARHKQVEGELAAMRKLLARRQSLQQDDEDNDEDSSVAVGGGSQQQAVLSAKSKSNKRANANNAAQEEDVEALRARIQELEAEQARAKQHRHGNTENIARVGVAAGVEHAFEDGATAHRANGNSATSGKPAEQPDSCCLVQ
jgi:Leucine Rich repeat